MTRSAVDELLATLGGLRVLDAVWFVDFGQFIRNPYAYVRIDGVVYELSMNGRHVALDVAVAEPGIDDDIIAAADGHRVGPHVVEIRGRCTCGERVALLVGAVDKGKRDGEECVDGLYAVDDATGHVVLDVAAQPATEIIDKDRMLRSYSDVGVDAPWLIGTRET